MLSRLMPPECWFPGTGRMPFLTKKCPCAKDLFPELLKLSTLLHINCLAHFDPSRNNWFLPVRNYCAYRPLKTLCKVGITLLLINCLTPFNSGRKKLVLYVSARAMVAKGLWKLRRKSCDVLMFIDLLCWCSLWVWNIWNTFLLLG